MQIRFKAPDPRAGTVAQMDSSRGQHFIDTGAAVQVNEDGRAIASSPVPTRAGLDEALAGLPGDYDDPDYVVRGMRSHYGELFTQADEDHVRAVVKPRERKPSEGLTVEQLKAALKAKGIAIPEGVKLKPELAALLDNAA